MEMKINVEAGNNAESIVLNKTSGSVSLNGSGMSANGIKLEDTPKQNAPQPQKAAPQPTPNKAQATMQPNTAQVATPKPTPSQASMGQTQKTSKEAESADNLAINADFLHTDEIHHQEGDARLNAPIETLSSNPNIQNLIVDVDKLNFSVTRKIRAYLKKLISVNGSDLHLKAGAKIRARIHGDIVVFSEEVFSKDDALTFAKELSRTRFPEFALNKEMDMTYIYDTKTRFRVNMFFQMDGVSFVFRQIPTTQSSIEDLGLPKSLHNIVNMERGLVLVTGITGSGKSTTLAAIINEINQKHAKHIITIEDPIEFIHHDIKSILNQRSVGMDTNSFAGALKAALREDPDIILVGEMRDLETIEMALHAAETGHLVLSTLHTIDAKETINRIISIYNPAEQQRVRKVLSSVLTAVVSQRLLKSRDGKRAAAIEILFKTPRIETIIDEGRDGEILEALEEGKEIYQTQTFDQHLFELVVGGIVDEEVAMEKATSPSDLKLKLQNISKGNLSNDDMISIKQ